MFKPWIIVSFLFILLSAQVLWADDFSTSRVWQRLYQYKNNKSKIEAPVFFFSPEGRTNPHKELDAAIEAFKDTKKLYGTLQLPAACAFPARKQILEKNLGLKFPTVKCKDLDEWIERFNADHLSIDFAGAYSGNPASILGHTFLRFYTEKKGREGHDLLSYAVGFLAVSTPGDSRAMYMIRGLTGQYPGYYQIEPYYMKVGLYNNSESRDIWEQKLNLTPQEVKTTLLLLWEYSFNSKIPYYFIDENCSYRLLTLLEVVRPDADLISELSPVVLPSDTIRVLIKNGIASSDPKFRSSILRRLDSRVEKLNSEERSKFEKSKKDLKFLEQVKVANVLDALIDYWTYANYKVQTNLKPEDSQLMEAAFLQRAKLPEVTTPIDDEVLRAKENLTPTYLGHKTSWISLSGGSENISSRNRLSGQFSYRMGAHSLTDAQPGYEGIAAIEYLGLDIEPRDIWKILVVDVKSIEPLNAPEKNWSWLASISIDHDQNDLSNTRLSMRGGGGGAVGISNFGKLYLMPELSSQTWVDDNPNGILGVGFESGFVANFFKQNILLSHESVWNRLGYFANSNIMYSYHCSYNNTIFVKYEIKDLINSAHGWQVGYKLHF